MLHEYSAKRSVPDTGVFRAPSLPSMISNHRPCADRLTFKTFTTMPRFIVTTKMRKNTNGVFIEPGMSVEVVTQSPANPVITNGGTLVQERFLAIYGVDLKRAGSLNMMCLDVKQA